MNQRFDPNDNRPINPTAWPDEAVPPRNDHVAPDADPRSRPPLTDPLAGSPIPQNIAAGRPARSSWPILIILLAGLVLALLVWLPAERSGDPTASDTATQPAPSSQTVTPPAATTTPPAGDGVAPSTAAPDTMETPAAPPQAAPEQPATGTTTPPATNGTAPQN